MSLGKFAELDADTRTRIDAACSFVNHKIAEQRKRFYTVLVWSAVGAILFWELTRVDIRIPAALLLLVAVLMMAYAQKKTKQLYKSLVVPRIVEALGNGLSYRSESSFTADQFRAMDLFSERLDRFHSEDQVSGRLQEVDYTLNEVRAARREQHGKNTSYVQFFKGVVVMLEFNKNFQGQTVVVPDREGKLLGLFGQRDSRDGKQRVNLADAEFEKVYAVFSSNDQEANYLLTPKLLQLIMRARASMGDLRLSFMQNMLFVTVPSSADRFEVSLFARKVTPFEAIGDLAAVVHLAEQLIESLDLETRIWTRV